MYGEIKVINLNYKTSKEIEKIHWDYENNEAKSNWDNSNNETRSHQWKYANLNDNYIANIYYVQKSNNNIVTSQHKQVHSKYTTGQTNSNNEMTLQECLQW